MLRRKNITIFTATLKLLSFSTKTYIDNTYIDNYCEYKDTFCTT